MMVSKPIRSDAEIEMPRDITINGIKWYILVKRVSEEPLIKGHAGLTLCDEDNENGTHEIIIRKRIAKDYGKCRMTLLHEVLHAIRFSYDKQPPPKRNKLEDWEHYFVDLYEHALPVVMHENPELSAFIFSRNYVDKNLKLKKIDKHADYRKEKDG